MEPISAQRRREIIDALRRGTVPQRGLDVFAVGLGRFEPALDEELRPWPRGGAGFKAVRGEYGWGKTFFARWLQERAKRQGFAAAEVQISETETPLHRLETVYRRAMERLSTADASRAPSGRSSTAGSTAWRRRSWPRAGSTPRTRRRWPAATEALLEQRLVGDQPGHAPVRRGPAGLPPRPAPRATPPRPRGWSPGSPGQPHVGAAAKRAAGIKGEVDHFAALSFLQGLLTVLRDSGYAGLVLVLDEIETLQRVRGDVREKGLNALRQLIDEIDAGRFPGLYLVITGTPAFFDGPQGVRRLEPLAQRLHVDFQTDARFDNPRAVQLRLPGFDHDRLVEVGRTVRDLYAARRPGPRPGPGPGRRRLRRRAGRRRGGRPGRQGRRRPPAVPQEAGRRRARPDRPVPRLRPPAALPPDGRRRRADPRRAGRARRRLVDDVELDL